MPANLVQTSRNVFSCSHPHSQHCTTGLLITNDYFITYIGTNNPGLPYPTVSNQHLGWKCNPTFCVLREISWYVWVGTFFSFTAFCISNFYFNSVWFFLTLLLSTFHLPHLGNVFLLLSQHCPLEPQLLSQCHSHIQGYQRWSTGCAENRSRARGQYATVLL